MLAKEKMLLVDCDVKGSERLHRYFLDAIIATLTQNFNRAVCYAKR